MMAVTLNLFSFVALSNFSYLQLISFYMMTSIALNGLFIALLSVYFLTSDWVHSNFRSDAHFLTGYFCFFIFSTNFNSFNVRTKDVQLLRGIETNQTFLVVLFFIGLVQFLFTFAGKELFNTVPLNFEEWTLVLVLAALVVPFDLMRKRFMMPILRKHLKPRLATYRRLGMEYITEITFS